jgi:hypothetical protein
MRDQLRAVLVGLHLLAVLLMSIPAPAGMSRQTLQEENIQANFRDWSDLAKGLGINLEAAKIEELSFTWGTRVLGVRNKALAPFRPYYKYAGTNQRWQMFGYLNRTPGRIEVATCDKINKRLCAKQDWDWRFIMGSDEADWLRPRMEQERIRAIVSSFAWKKRKGHYNALGRWLAAQAAEDFPDAKTLRVRMGTLQIPPPARLRELDEVPVGDYYWEETFPIPDPKP